MKWTPQRRTVILFFAGLTGVAVETVGSVAFSHPVDPSLLVIFGGMMGLPLFLRGDEK